MAQAVRPALISVLGMWQESGIYDATMPQSPGVQTVLIALCLVAGFSALAGLSSVVAVLLLGLGLAGLVMALGFGVVALGAGLWAAVLAFSHPSTSRLTFSGAAGS